MSGSFVGLEIARSGLTLSQKSLDIVSKNIANVNTQGYSRQRVVSTPASYDLGVEFVSVEQIRDQFIDNQVRSESSKLGELSTKADALSSMGDFLQEPSDNGLNSSIGSFFNSIQELSKQPQAKEIRTQVRQNAINMVDGLHYLYNKFTELQQNQDQQIVSTVSQINSYATDLQTLNEQITRSEISGQKANELRDQRNNILDSLSQLVNISQKENTDGTVSVAIGGSDLVNNGVVNKLVATSDKANPISGETGLLTSIKWGNSSGEEASITGGKLKGYIDIRDGQGVGSNNNPNAMGVPYFVEKINLLSKTIAKTINDIHKTGYTMPNENNNNTSVSGINFFTPADAENEVTAKNITISDEVMNNVYNIATSDKVITSTNAGNNNIIKQIADIRDNKGLTMTVGATGFNIGSIEGYTKEITSEVAIESSRVSKSLDAQEAISQSVENRRSSISGVSIDEEFSNMIKFQHAYSAAAKMMSTIDSTLDTLINSFGR